MTDNTISQLAAAPAMGENSKQTQQGSAGWLEAFARAWGQALDNKADQMIARSEEIRTGTNANPSNIAALTASSLEFSYLAQSQNTSLSSVGEGLKTMARKQ